MHYKNIVQCLSKHTYIHRTEANESTIFPEDTRLFTLHVSALYTNIPHDEGLNCMEEALNEKDIDQSSLKFPK